MSGITEKQLWGGYSGIPVRIFECEAGHLTRLRTTNQVAYCSQYISARATCSRPAKPKEEAPITSE